MLGRLVAKLMFKACVPLVAVAGVMTYGVYLKGGDPAGLWKHLANGAFGQAGDMFSQAKNDAVGLAGNLTAEGGVADALGTRSEPTRVFTWKDDQGVTHFGTTAPEGVSAETLTVNPNVNVLAPVVATKTRDDAFESGDETAPGSGMPHATRTVSRSGNGSRSGSSGQINQSVRQLEADMGEPLPGVGGQLLSGGAAGGNGMDPAQLIRLLQSAGQ